MRLIGLDPGLRQTGWGIIDTKPGRLSFVDCGEISAPSSLSLSARIGRIDRGVFEAVARHEPAAAAVEEVFVNRNPLSSLRLGLARGAAVAALARAGLEVHEYASSSVKKSLTGNGAADKDQVAAMVRMLLPIARPESKDASDALAVAICHAHHNETLSNIVLKGNPS